MTAPKPRLRDVEARAAAATTAPWTSTSAEFRDSVGHSVKSEPSGMVVAFGGFGPAGGRSHLDATFIAASRTDVPALTAAIRAVLAIHPRLTAYTSASSDPNYVPNTADYCGRCHGNYEFGRWPCNTYAALSAHIDLDES